MYTSVTKKEPLVWLGITVFTIIFAAVYEHFSFGVWSNAMVFMFVFPLILGFIPSLILAVARWGYLPRLWNDGVLVITVGSLLTGIIEIYGSDSYYTPWFFYIGTALLILGVLQIIFTKKDKARSELTPKG